MWALKNELQSIAVRLHCIAKRGLLQCTCRPRAMHYNAWPTHGRQSVKHCNAAAMTQIQLQRTGRCNALQPITVQLQCITMHLPSSCNALQHNCNALNGIVPPGHHALQRIAVQLQCTSTQRQYHCYAIATRLKCITAHCRPPAKHCFGIKHYNALSGCDALQQIAMPSRPVQSTCRLAAMCYTAFV